MYYAAGCSTAVSLAEARALSAALQPLSRALLLASPAPGEQLTAHACLFALLSALERGKVGAETADALMVDDAFSAAELAPLRAALRLALALAKPSGGEEVLRGACEACCFDFLRSLVRQPLRLRDLYTISCHELVSSFLDDERGRHAVQHLLQSSAATLGALLLLLSTLYTEGLEDLSSQCSALWEFIDFVTEGIACATERRRGDMSRCVRLHTHSPPAALRCSSACWSCSTRSRPPTCAPAPLVPSLALTRLAARRCVAAPALPRHQPRGRPGGRGHRGVRRALRERGDAAGLRAVAFGCCRRAPCGAHAC
jgi:hypothetical protein